MMMNQKSDYIGVFDSGLGGISVLRELIKLMPQERFLYFGDSANAPYGTRSTQEVRTLTLSAAHSLVKRGVKALVIACNTATSAAIETLRKQYPDLIVIGIEPALKSAADKFPCGRIGVMATDITLREEKFTQQLARFPQAKVSLISAPGLVEQIEAGAANSKQTQILLETILKPYIGKLDALVLGCTHYPFAQACIREILGPDVWITDGGAGTARQTKRCLEQADLLHTGKGCVEMENSLPGQEILQRALALLQE